MAVLRALLAGGHMRHAKGTCDRFRGVGLAVSAEYGDPEKRKVGGSTPPLPTVLARASRSRRLPSLSGLVSIAPLSGTLTLSYKEVRRPALLGLVVDLKLPHVRPGPIGSPAGNCTTKGASISEPGGKSGGRPTSSLPSSATGAGAFPGPPEASTGFPSASSRDSRSRCRLLVWSQGTQQARPRHERAAG